MHFPPLTIAWAPCKRTVLIVALASLAGGCALTGGVFDTVGPTYQAEPVALKAWQLPQPSAAQQPFVAHGGSADALRQWWQQFDDPVLTGLLDAAQRSSATLAQAAARIESARADVLAAGVAGSPAVDASAGVNRSAFSFGGPAVQRTQASVGVQSSWEIDLFGGLARQRESARAQLDANLAAWHDARVALAAEVANAYVSYRFCEMQAGLARADAASRGETARLAGITAAAGLQAPAVAALARAGAADAAAALAQRQAQCDIDIKGLVALTAQDEPALRTLLARPAGTLAVLPRPRQFVIDAVPAQVLAQRPDVAGAEREVAAASAAIGMAEAARFPRLSLAGNVTPTRSRLDGSPAISVTTWSIGPSLTLPLFDGGRRAADVEVAQAQYRAAEAGYRARVRSAVREVEEAMVRLAGLAARQQDTRSAAAGYREHFEAARTRQAAGLASLVDLEEARRVALAADGAVAALDYESVATWITLYRAVGGGWDGRLDLRLDQRLDAKLDARADAGVAAPVNAPASTRVNTSSFPAAISGAPAATSAKP